MRAHTHAHTPLYTQIQHTDLQSVAAINKLPLTDEFNNIYCHMSVMTRGLCFVCVCVCVCVCAGGEELHSDCLAVVQAPKVLVDPQLTLPLDINNYLMTHYIRAIFRVNTHTQTHTHTHKQRNTEEHRVNM